MPYRLIIFTNDEKHPLGDDIDNFVLNIHEIGRYHDIKDKFCKFIQEYAGSDIIEIFDSVEISLENNDYYHYPRITDDGLNNIWNYILENENKLMILCRRYLGIMVHLSMID